MVVDTPVVVNLLAGSGAGKSTCAARIFAMLKEQGVEVELVTEYVKDMVWEKRPGVFKCQPYIFGKQLYKQVRLAGSVDVIVTDSPIVLSALYDPEHDPDFRKFIVKKFNQFNNVNFFLERAFPFNPNGRHEKSLEDAIWWDNRLMSFLKEEEVNYTIIRGNQEGCTFIVNKVIDMLNGGGF